MPPSPDDGSIVKPYAQMKGRSRGLPETISANRKLWKSDRFAGFFRRSLSGPLRFSVGKARSIDEWFGFSVLYVLS